MGYEYLVVVQVCSLIKDSKFLNKSWYHWRMFKILPGNLTKHMKSKAHMKKCLELGVSVTCIDDIEGVGMLEFLWSKPIIWSILLYNSVRFIKRGDPTFSELLLFLVSRYFRGDPKRYWKDWYVGNHGGAPVFRRRWLWRTWGRQW